MDYLPIFIDLRGRACLVVGGGMVALRKLELLLRAGGVVRIVAPVPCAPLLALADQARASVVRRAYRSADLAGVHLVVAATDQAEVNATVAEEAKARAIPVNVVDAPELCSFIMPAIVDRSPLLVAVSTAGASPVLARLTRAKLEAALPHGMGRLAGFAARHRALVKRRVPDPAVRRRLWEHALDGEIAALVLADQDAEAERALLRAIDHGGATDEPSVALLASGDGDTDRLSLAAARWLSRADCVLHERAVSTSVLELSRRDAERVDLGTRLGEPGAWSCAELAAHVAERARKGQRVCVVRTGDPYALGTNEEATRLGDAGLRVTVLRPAP
jgi:uroporphyrin-III C-methyltransferase/precorrin-2 dehydrogenase/sirohydrochlorin ferrochelatase